MKTVFLTFVILGWATGLQAQQIHGTGSSPTKKPKQVLMSNCKASSAAEQQTRTVVEQFYAILAGKSTAPMESIFVSEVDWDLPGNEQKFPWSGKRRTKEEVLQFFQLLKQNVRSEKFEVHFIAVNGENAVAIGELASRILKYDKVFTTEFAAIFKVIDGKIVKYHFLEDGYKLNEMMK